MTRRTAYLEPTPTGTLRHFRDTHGQVGHHVGHASGRTCPCNPELIEEKS